jgi:hypothetical protein
MIAKKSERRRWENNPGRSFSRCRPKGRCTRIIDTDADCIFSACGLLKSLAKSASFPPAKAGSTRSGLRPGVALNTVGPTLMVVFF